MTGDLSTEIGGTSAAQKVGNIGRVPSVAITGLRNEVLLCFVLTGRIPRRNAVRIRPFKAAVDP